MQAKMKNKKVLLALATVLSFVIILSATFAWMTAKDNVVNKFATAKITDGSVEIFEIFEPPTEWKPDQAVTKQVSVINHGEGDVLVRISFEEYLSKLSNGGQIKGTTTGTPSGTEIPVPMNAAPYSAANGWETLTELGLTSTTLPPGATIMGKKMVAGTLTSYTFIIFNPTTFETKAISQKMSATFEVANTVLTVTDAKYYYFDGKDENQADWAGENEVIGKAPYPVATVTPVHPALADIGRLSLDENIKLTYTSDLDISATPTAGKWFYNAPDGYFYYINKLESGQSSLVLLDSVTLDKSVDDAYSMMNLDLIVTLEAIQNTADAIASATGWGLTDPALLAALTPYCEY